MPSPLAHSATGFAVYNILSPSGKANSKLLRVSILFSILPDLDSILGLIGRDFYRFHNNISHSMGFAVATGLLAGTIWGWGKGLFWRWFSAGFLAYGLHLGLDFWSTRRGILLFWPLSSRRFIAPAKLFYGFQWGLGLWSKTHLWTLLTEMLFGLVLIGGTRFLKQRLKN